MGKNLWLLSVSVACLIIVLTVSIFTLCQTSPQTPQLPDLMLLQDGQVCLIVVPSVASKGVVVSASAVVRNRLGVPVDTFDVEFSWRRVDKEEVCGFKRESVSGLVGYEPATIEATIDTANLTPGTYEVTVWVDPDDEVPEDDETNNRCSTQLTILPPQPELHPISLGFNPTSPVEWGETVRSSAELENTGKSAAGKFLVEFLLSPVWCENPKTNDAFRISTQKNDSKVYFAFSPIDTSNTADSSATNNVTLSDIPHADWIPFGSTIVPGLERDEHLQVWEVLDTAGGLSDLLAWRLNAYDISKTAADLDDLQLKQLKQLKSSATTYVIKVVIREPDGVKELDPSNNMIIRALTVTPSKLDLPELRPVSITFNRDLPLDWGRDITATALVINSGGLKAEDIRIDFYYRKVGAGVWTWFTHAFIKELGIEEQNNDEEVEGKLRLSSLDVSPGNYEIKVEVNPPLPESGDIRVKNGASWVHIEEQNEDNNNLIAAFSVQGSELHPLSIELGAAPVHQGDTITVVSQIENMGSKPAERFTVGFFIDDLRFDTFYYQDKDGLKKNEIAYAQGTLDTTDLPAGEDYVYALRVVVDPDDQISEMDEADNVMSTALKILPRQARLAELHPVKLILDPPSPVGAGQVVGVSVTICNTGSINAERFQVQLAYREKDEGNTWQVLPPQEVLTLARGEKKVIKRELSTIGLAVDKTYEIKVSVDVGGQVDEDDENNNQLICAFSLGTPISGPSGPGEATLSIQNMAFSATSVPQGTPVAVIADIINRSQEALGKFAVEFAQRRQQVGAFALFDRAQIFSLGAREVRSIRGLLSTAFLSPGIYEIRIIVDPANQVGGRCEQVRTLTILAVSIQKPDLTPVTVSLSPAAQVRQGEPVSVCVTIKNLGGIAIGSFSVSYAYLRDSSVPFATGTVSGLVPSGETVLCQGLDTERLEPGTYKIMIMVDPDTRVAEENEENNLISTNLTVTRGPEPRAESVLETGGPVRILALEEGTGTVYIASEDGKLYALERGAVPKSGFPFDAESPIRALVLDTGARRAAYLGTEGGSLCAVALDTGHELAPAVSLGSEILALDVDTFGTIYIGKADGLASLQQGWDSSRELINFDIVGAVGEVIVDNVRDVVYAITSSGLYAFNVNGSLKWRFGLTAPSALALGEEAIYVGTKNGMVYAVDFSGSPDRNPKWNYAAEGEITAIVVDMKRDDPIYVTSSAGKLYALDHAGNEFWTFPAEGTIGAIHSIPAIDDRSGLIIFGSDDGVPYALNADGTTSFAPIVENPVCIHSNLVIDALVEQQGSSVQVIRTFYFGAEDHTVYIIKTNR